MKIGTLIKAFGAIGVAFGALCGLSTGAYATALPIFDSGILDLSNLGGSLVGITASPSLCINWGGGSTCVAGTEHEMTVSGISTDFSIGASPTDLIQDLPGLPGPTVVNFEEVLGSGLLGGETVHFDLTGIPLPNGGAGLGNCLSNAPDNVCAPAGSPFKLSEDDFGSQVTISFSASLNAYTGTSTSGSTPYRAIFSTTYSGTLAGAGACSGLVADITNILSCEAAGGTIDSTWSASESPILGTPTPEPANVALFGSGLLGLGLYFRGRRA